MKKTIVYILGFTFTLLLFSSCKATKGCGLTSEVITIEQPISILNNTLITKI